MTVERPVYLPAETTSAADANQPYTDLATESADIKQEHTRTEWVTTKHMKISGNNPLTPYFGSVEDDNHTGNYTSATFVVISHPAGTTIRLSPAITLNQGEVLRIHGGCLVKEVTLNDRTQDLYWFRFLSNMSVDGGANADVQLGHDWGYSMASRNDSDAGGNQVYGYQRVGFSWTHICQNTTELINTLELQIKLEDALSTVEIGEVSLYAIQSIH